MNLSPLWTETLQAEGHDVVHWRDVGPANSRDDAILDWAARNGRAVFTADLDFGVAVVRRRMPAPEVIQLRLESTDPLDVGTFVIEALRMEGRELRDGAVLTIADHRARLRPGPNSQTQD